MLSTLPDPTPQVVPVSTDTEGLQRTAEWYKSSSSQCDKESLEPCSGFAYCPYSNGRPGRGRQSNEQRNACRKQKCSMPVGCMKSVGSKEVRSQRRHWREKQLECLHRRATTKIVHSESGRYEEKLRCGGVVCSIMIGDPVCLMLFVHGVLSFRFSPCFLHRVRHSVHDKCCAPCIRTIFVDMELPVGHFNHSDVVM